MNVSTRLAHRRLLMPVWLLVAGIWCLGIFSGPAQEPPTYPWTSIQVPGAWEDSGLPDTKDYDGFAWYRTWFKPHASYFTPHERNLFAESVTLTIRDLAEAHELFVNGRKIGSGGSMPPDFLKGTQGNHRHKVPPGLLRQGEWNVIVIRVYNHSGPGGFLKEAPFIMDYFMECVFAGTWEFRMGDDPAWAEPIPLVKPPRSAFDQFHESNRLLGEAETTVPGPRLAPADSLAAMKVEKEWQVEQLLTEPLVAQPVHLSFDERGRLWVSQYRQYPYPAGLSMVSRDKYYRTHYAEVPPAPPHHTPGRDRITIHEDTDGDGLYDRHKVFLDGLNMANAAVRGRHGVWVMHTPYLLFYPDRDFDDLPDGPPEVRLQGFGLEDSHSIANGLIWGPDGWLYGAQGSTTSSRVTRPDVDPPAAEGIYFEGCMVWRYHPVTRKYEIFAQGGGNIFSLSFDAQGRLFSGHNGGNTRGWHYVQNAYYLMQGVNPGKFGPPRNPFAFGDLPMMKSLHPVVRFSHAVTLAEGTAVPSLYAGKLLTLDPLHNVVIASDRLPRGATFQTRDIGPVLTGEDSAFRPVFLCNAPDGSILVADFYEHYIAHGQHYQSQIDPTTGRIYRLRSKNRPLENDLDLSRKSSRELLDLLSHPNPWHRQTAGRLLARSTAADTGLALRRLIGNEPGQTALEALWALHLGWGLDEPTALTALKHPYAPVRTWTVRLLGDQPGISSALFQAILTRAHEEPEVETRSQMASTAQQLPTDQAMPLVLALLHHEQDAKDPFIPLLCWWVLEKNLHQHRDQVLEYFTREDTWKHATMVETILPRLMRQLALTGTTRDLEGCARLLQMAPTALHQDKLVEGFEQAFQGRSMTGLPASLMAALAEASKGRNSLVLRIRQAQPQAAQEGLRILQSSEGNLQERLLILNTLADLRHPEATRVFLSLAETSKDQALRQAALNALGRYEDPRIAQDVIRFLPTLPQDLTLSAINLLASRPAWTGPLLEAVRQKTIPTEAIPQEMVRGFRLNSQEEVRLLADTLFAANQDPQAPNAMAKLTELKTALQGSSGNPYAGEPIFMTRCALCHRLFFKGKNLGPDLTPYQRDDLDALLRNILSPDAEIREGFQSVEINTKDGRSITGFLKSRDLQGTTIQGLDGANIHLSPEEIQQVRVWEQSLMPEGLLDGLSTEELSDLFAYLRISQPITQ